MFKYEFMLHNFNIHFDFLYVEIKQIKIAKISNDMHNNSLIVIRKSQGHCGLSSGPLQRSRFHCKTLSFLKNLKKFLQIKGKEKLKVKLKLHSISSLYMVISL